MPGGAQGKGCMKIMGLLLAGLFIALSAGGCGKTVVDTLYSDADVTVFDGRKELCAPGGGRQGFMFSGYLVLRRAEGNYRAYVRFDLDGIDPSTISSARLMLWKSRDREDTLRVYAVADDSWDEYETAWGNAPQMGDLVASGYCRKEWNTFEVTDYVRSQTDNAVTFGMRVENGTEPGLGFNTREGGAPPRLLVAHTGPPAGDTPPNPGFPSTSSLEHGVYINDRGRLIPYDDISTAVNNIQPGQEIVLGPGIYYQTFDLFPDGTAEKPLKIRGDGDPRPIIDGSLNSTAWQAGDYGRGDRGLIRITGDYWTIEHLEVRNAHPWAESPQQNTACIFIHDAKKVTIRDCGVYFGGNGIFATSSTEDLTLEYNEVAYNSFPGSAYKHGHYVSGPGITTVRFCHIHHNGGANFKSRSEHCVFAYNYVHSPGNYHIDLSAGHWEDQDAVLIGNVVVTDNEHRTNPQFIVFGENRHGGSLLLYNNTFINLYPQGYAFVHMWFPDENAKVLGTTLEAYNNAFLCDSSRGGMRFYRTEKPVPVLGSNNWITQGVSDIPSTLRGTIQGSDPQLMDLEKGDFRPKPSSPLVDRGSLQAPQFPEYEYIHPRGKRARTVSGARLDIGAYESGSN
ncbi:MAG TPA: DNRLRE domain-containing protein [archaeon]|nr:DNRLRE domain-containing protein [archaeon]